MRKLVWKVLNYFSLGGSVQLFLSSVLKEEGWFRSFHTKQSVDAHGNPVPWLTYSFIHFIKPRLNKSFHVFEYGSGNSTKWLAQYTGSVTSAEHDASWFEHVKKQLPQNATLKFAHPEAYAQSIKGDKRYDIIIIDGIERNDCTKYAIENITEQGVIVLDNSDRDIYQPSFDMLQQAGFRRIDFWGMIPIVAAISCTSVFYKNNNCLNI